MYIKSKKKSYQSSFFQVAGQDLIPSYDSAVTDAGIDSRSRRIHARDQEILARTHHHNARRPRRADGVYPRFGDCAVYLYTVLITGI